MSKYLNALRQILLSGNTGLIFIISVLITSIISLVLSEFVASGVLSIIRSLFSRSSDPLSKEDLLPAKKPLKIVIVSSVTYLMIYSLASSLTKTNSSYIVFLAFSKKLYRVLMILLFSMILYKLVPTLLRMYQRLSRTDDLSKNPIVLVFIQRMLQLIVMILGFIIALSEIGINVNGLITGLGLGGLTFALAAQDTASNIFGGVVILSDKPFAVGDWIQTPDAEGIVEDITFRSSRIRTFDDALVVLPNSKLTNTAITNWTKMNKRKLKFYVGLTYDTAPDVLRSILDEIRYFLKNHPEILSESVIVRLDEFAPSSLNILVQLYTDVISLEELKRVREEINFEVLDIVAKSGSRFAFPSTSVYMQKN
ncbi:MAG: mechanosensitive ion channel family protein [Peptostreptococcaceae bacterium]|nr:mechanosensitive ion channel family protein [Peptostreptococcaceae bacterium]